MPKELATNNLPAGDDIFIDDERDKLPEIKQGHLSSSHDDLLPDDQIEA